MTKSEATPLADNNMSLLAFGQLVEEKLQIDYQPQFTPVQQVAPTFKAPISKPVENKYVHNFTPRIPEKGNQSTILALQALKSERQNQNNLNIDQMKDQLQPVAVGSSLIGKQSAKDRVDKFELFQKHDIALKGTKDEIKPPV